MTSISTRTEGELLPPLLNWLSARRQIRDGSVLATELPWHGRRVDLAILNSSGGCAAFELKLSHNRRVMEQSYLNGTSFDRSYLVTGTRPSSVKMEAASQLGLGVIHVDLDCGKVALLRPAPRSPVHPVVRRRLRDAIRRRGQRSHV